MSRSATVFDKEHRALTLGILIVLTMVAFESLAVVTIAPSIARAFDGLEFYGWIFSGQLLASLFSIVVAGQEADKSGPATPFMIGLALFTLGLIVAGFAPSMLTFVMGRVLQGLGGGAVTVAVYVAVNLAYSDDIRSRMIAFMSTAWVVPALAGPVAAGVIAESVGWRYVFLGMLPLTLVVAFMTIGAMLKLKRKGGASESQWLLALILVLGTGLLLFGLGVSQLWVLALMVLVGISAAVPSLNKLLPKGTLKFQMGLPSVIAARGFFYSSFIGVEAFLALMLTSIHGLSASLTGVAIAAAAISWTVGSWIQDQWDKRGNKQRQTRIVIGSSVMTVGLVIQFWALYTPAYPLLITLVGWALAGLGIGVAHGTTAVLAFALAPEGEEGNVSAGLQLADTFLAALSTGVGGALFAVATTRGGSEQLGVMLAFIFSVSLAFLSVFSALRVGRSPETIALTSQTNDR